MPAIISWNKFHEWKMLKSYDLLWKMKICSSNFLINIVINFSYQLINQFLTLVREIHTKRPNDRLKGWFLSIKHKISWSIYFHIRLYDVLWSHAIRITSWVVPTIFFTWIQDLKGNHHAITSHWAHFDFLMNHKWILSCLNYYYL